MIPRTKFKCSSFRGIWLGLHLQARRRGGRSTLWTLPSGMNNIIFFFCQARHLAGVSLSNDTYVLVLMSSASKFACLVANKFACLVPKLPGKRDSDFPLNRKFWNRCNWISRRRKWKKLTSSSFQGRFIRRHLIPSSTAKVEMMTDAKCLKARERNFFNLVHKSYVCDICTFMRQLR